MASLQGEKISLRPIERSDLDFLNRWKNNATGACRLIENYARNYLNLRKITLKAVADNQRAVSMWHSHSYKNVGELREEQFINGKYCNLLILEDLRRYKQTFPEHYAEVVV